MPYDNGNNIEEYQSYLVKVDSKLSENHYACLMQTYLVIHIGLGPN